MTEQPAMDARRQRIQDVEDRARALKEQLAHETMKDYVDLTLLDLKEARAWLKRAEAEGTAVLGYWQVPIQIAVMRLDHAEAMLEKFGPNVMMVRAY